MIQIHDMGGHYYVYEISSKWDPEKKKARKVTGKAVGKITEKDGYIPNLYGSLKMTPLHPVVKNHGAYEIVDQLSDHLENKLRKCFPDIYREISTIAKLQLVTGCKGKRIKREFEASYLTDLHPDLPCSDYTVKTLIKANLVVTDPPYNVAYESADGKKIQNDSMADEQFFLFLLAAFQNMAAHMAEGGSAYIFHADTEGLNFRRAFKESGFHISGVCIWVKNSLVLGRSPYQWQHEPVLYGWLPNGKHTITQGTPEKVNLLVDIQARLQKAKSPGYERWAKGFNLKEMAKTFSYLREHELLDRVELDRRADEASGKTEKAMKRIREIEDRQREIGQLKTHIIQYSKTREIYAQYKKSNWSPKFDAQHEQEIAMHKAAKKAFDALGVKKLPKVAELNVEYACLQTEKNALYADYKWDRDEKRQLLIVQENVRRILDTDPQQKQDISYRHIRF